MNGICLIPTDLRQGRFGHEARLGDVLAGRTVLEHTVRRAAAVPGVERIVLLHPADQSEDQVRRLLGPTMEEMGVPVRAFAVDGGLADRWTPMRQSARKWAMTAWRGGLGGACVFDELLPAEPLRRAWDAWAAEGEMAMLVRGDWCGFDVELAGRQLERLAEAPEARKLTFSQAPPGLGTICVTRPVLDQLADNDAGFGDILTYNPHRPTGDPISREVCLSTPAQVRNCFERFIYDTPRAREMLEAMAQRLGPGFSQAEGPTLVEAYGQVKEALRPASPRYVTMELTPRRNTPGPITPGHYVEFDRGPMDTDLALKLVDQLGRWNPPNEPGETALLLGGLGDGLLHPDWARIVQAAHGAGVFGVGIETDLLCDQKTLDQILCLPLDLVSVRLNADSAQTYQQLMGVDGFEKVMDNLRYLFENRNAHGRQPGLPWILPRLAKTRDNVSELETFFERWLRVARHAVIESPPTARGRMPDLSPVPMNPPRPLPTPVRANQMVVLSNGQVTRDIEDWFADDAIGSAVTQPLVELWASSPSGAPAQ